MEGRESGERGDFVVHFRVVLHSARAERVGSQVNREALVRQTREVANHFHLTHLGQADSAADGILRKQVTPRGNVESGQGKPLAPCPALLEDEPLVRHCDSPPPPLPPERLSMRRSVSPSRKRSGPN